MSELHSLLSEKTNPDAYTGRICSRFTDKTLQWTDKTRAKLLTLPPLQINLKFNLALFDPPTRAPSQ